MERTTVFNRGTGIGHIDGAIGFGSVHFGAV